MADLEYPNAVDFYCTNEFAMPSRAYVTTNGIIVLTEKLEMVITLAWESIKKIKAKKSTCGISIKLLNGEKTQLVLVRHTELGRFLLAAQGFTKVHRGVGWKLGRRVLYIDHSSTRARQQQSEPKKSRSSKLSGDLAPKIELVHGSFERMDDPRYPTMFFDKRTVVPAPPPPTPATSPENGENGPKTPGQIRRSERLARSALYLSNEDIQAALDLRPHTPPPKVEAPAWQPPEALLVPPFRAGELLWGFDQSEPAFLYPPHPCHHAWYENCGCSQN